MPQVQPELTFRALSLLLIVFLGLTCVVFSLVSMWKENRFGWPLRGIIWFTVAIVGSCAVIALLAGYVQKARSLEKVSHRVEAVTRVGMNMQITEITIHPTNDGLVRAYVDIVFDNCFMIRDIRVIQGPTGLFVSFPAKKQRDGTHRDIAFPANAETRNMIQRVILAEYEKLVAESAPEGHPKINIRSTIQSSFLNQF